MNCQRFSTGFSSGALGGNAVGDRVQFTDTLRSAQIYNGNAGVITGIDAHTGAMRATLDSSGGGGREVMWSASEFDGFRHGYAGTIYKGQGKTLDHTYLYHSHHWRQSSSYVALTRQRKSAQIFAAIETARDLTQLARQMSRGEVRSASVAWATRDELAPHLRQTDEGRAVVREGREGEPFAQPRTDSSVKAETVASSRASQTEAAAPEGGWLIAPLPPAGPIDRGEVAAVIAGDRDVQREREALGNYLVGAYRDPHDARSRLAELVKTHGPTSAVNAWSLILGSLGSFRARWVCSPALRVARSGRGRSGWLRPLGLQWRGSGRPR